MVGKTTRGVRLKVDTIVITHIVEGVDVVMRMDVIRKLGGVIISKEEIEFGVARCSKAKTEKPRERTMGSLMSCVRSKTRVFSQCLMARNGGSNGSRRVDFQC